MNKRRSTTRWSLISALSLVLLAGGISYAEENVNATVEMSSRGFINMEMLAGNITVTVWDRDELRITGWIDDRKQELEIDSDGSDVDIEVDFIGRGKHRNVQTARLDLRVPRDASLSIETVSGQVSIDGLSGAIELESASGVYNIKGPSTELVLETISGSMDLEMTRRVETLEMDVVSGSIEFRGEMAKDGDLSISSISGSIVLRLPESQSADFSVTTFSGSIKNELGPRARKTSEFLPSKELEFTMNGGSASIEIESFSGSVRILKN